MRRLVFSVVPLLACSFDSFGVGDTDAETGTGSTAADEDATGSGDGDGDATSGDGTTGDGTTGDGTAGDGDGTTGDGDGAECGNGLLDPGEDCDGSELGGADCTALGFVVGAGLSCSSGCQYDPSGCTAFCGNNTIEPGESCEDGNDDPNDGCANCNLTGLTCATRTPIVVGFGPGVAVSGSTVGGGSHTTEACDGPDGSPDRLFVLESTGSGFVTVWLDRPGTPFESILYTLADCLDPGSDGLCVDLKSPQPTSASGEVLSFWSSPGLQTTVVVDGFGGASGPFTLHARLAAGTCSDPVVLPFWSGGVRPNVGRTSAQPDGPPASCGGAGAGEVVYRVDSMEPGAVDVIASQGDASFPIMGSLRSACGDPGSELACDSSGDVVLNFAGAVGSQTFVILDGVGGASGEYGFSLGG